MYIHDFHGDHSGALCETCDDRYDVGGGPQWWPNAIDRQTGMLKLALRPVFMPHEAPEEVLKLLAEYLQPRTMP
jgi:hypothetical protein